MFSRYVVLNISECVLKQRGGMEGRERGGGSMYIIFVDEKFIDLLCVQGGNSQFLCLDDTTSVCIPYRTIWYHCVCGEQ